MRRTVLLALAAAVVAASAACSTLDDEGGVTRLDSALIPCAADLTIANPSPTPGSSYPSGLAFFEDSILAGAISGDTNIGRVDVFSSSSGAHLTSITDPDGFASGGFGGSIATVGTNFAVLALRADHDGDTIKDGAIWLFDSSHSVLWVATGGTHSIGETIASDGMNVFAGSPYDSLTGLNASGVVRQFGPTGQLVRTFTEPTPLANAKFGNALATGGGFLFVSTPGSSNGSFTPPGEVHVFSIATGQFIRTLLSPTGSQNSNGFGNHLATVDGSEEIIATGSNRAYRINGPTGSLLATYTVGVFNGTDIGRGVASMDGLVYTAVRFSSNGSMYVYELDGTYLYRIAGPTLLVGEDFGQNLVAAPGRILTSDPWRQGGGEAYQFATNRPPISTNTAVSTRMNEPRVITPNVVDPSGGTFALSIVAGPFHGAVVVTNGQFHYAPSLDYTGPDSIQFKADDGCNESNQGEVAIDVEVNNPPTISPVSVSAQEDVAKAFLLDAVDPNFDPITYTIVTAPEHGTLSGSGPNRTYTPAANYNGPDSFTYKASDGILESATATVTLTVSGVNDAPVASADVYSLDEDVPLAVPASGLLANDTDIDSASLTAAVVTQPASGTVSVAADGSFLYTPAANFSGAAAFTYRISDGALLSPAVTVSLTIHAVDDPPVAADDDLVAVEDVPTTLDLMFNDVDVDSQPQLTLDTLPAHGVLQISGASLVYMPHVNYAGPDSFTYHLSDATSSSALATVTLTLNGVSDPPTLPITSAPANGATIDPGDTLEWLPSQDVDGDALHYEVEIRLGATVAEALTTTTTSISFPPLDAGFYAWRVRAIDASGERSAFSPLRSVTLGGQTTGGCSTAPGRSTAGAWVLAGAALLTVVRRARA